MDVIQSFKLRHLRMASGIEEILRKNNQRRMLLVEQPSELFLIVTDFRYRPFRIVADSSRQVIHKHPLERSVLGVQPSADQCLLLAACM